MHTLQEAVQQHSKEDGSVAWAAVAAHLPGRTDKDVKRQRISMLAQCVFSSTDVLHDANLIIHGHALTLAVHQRGQKPPWAPEIWIRQHSSMAGCPTACPECNMAMPSAFSGCCSHSHILVTGVVLYWHMSAVQNKGSSPIIPEAIVHWHTSSIGICLL